MSKPRHLQWLCLFVLLPLLFSLAAAALLTAALRPVQRSENETLAAVAQTVREKYPLVSEEEIIAALSRKTASAEGSDLLKRYGIRETSWAVEENRQNAVIPAAAGAGSCTVVCWCMGGVLWLYARRSRKKTRQLTEYFSALNRGEYDLKVQSNEEGEQSRLQNEIYKTTVALREQSRLAKSAKEELKTAISDISHQLKTPLTSIGIMLDSLLEEDLPPDLQKDYLWEIRSATEHIGFLVQALLKLSRLDADSVEFRRKDEALLGLLRACAGKTEVMAELKGVELSVDCPPDITLYCDKKWMEEALTNIAKNCIEHTEAGGAVRLKAEQNHAYTEIRISDTGCGIAPDELPHIFERFYKTRHSGESSVGIGLALTKAIVEKQNGSIGAESAVGEGSVFTLRFPRL